ncbi:hypothetical protein KW835_13760 [Acidovorax sp. sic0104]|nr:hypothetical protein [Acidovorax sp. sic0104]
MGQVNAHVGDELVMRVGIPHKGGKLAFHAFNSGYPAMVSANAFWNPKKGQFVVPEASDLYEVPFALDSAGFVAVSQFQAKGKQAGMAGIYPWTAAQYLELASLLQPDWYSAPDLCCEKEIAGSQAEVDFRINATATLLEGTLQTLYAWQNELAKTESASVVANMLKPPVPVVQGFRKSDYLRCLDLIYEVWRRWEPWLAPPRLLGLGSVCRRATDHPEHGLYAILQALDGSIPPQTSFHLFGVKGTALAQVKKLGWIHSTDSMAWDVSARIKAHKGGYSNTLSRRSEEMTRWMSAACSRIAPSPGSQIDLGLFA